MAEKTAQTSIGDFVKDALDDWNDDGVINNSNSRPQRHIADIVKDMLDDGEVNESNTRPQRRISDIVKDAVDDMVPKTPTPPARPQRRPDPFEPKVPDTGPADDDVRSKIELFGSASAESATDSFVEDSYAGDYRGLAEGDDAGDSFDYGTTNEYGERSASIGYDESTGYDESISYDESTGYDESDGYDDTTGFADADYGDYEENTEQQYESDAF